MSRVEWCDKSVPEVRCRLEPGHDGLCCTGMEASLVVKCEHLRAEVSRLTRERDAAESSMVQAQANAAAADDEVRSVRASLAAARDVLREASFGTGRFAQAHSLHNGNRWIEYRAIVDALAAALGGSHG